MAKKMLIDATHAEETRVVVVDGNRVEEFDFEAESKRQLAGSIYLAKVTRVEPSLQAAFVDYGGNRHGFLAFAEIHPDYYQIPVADREALLAEEAALAENNDDDEPQANGKGRRRRKSRAESVKSDDSVVVSEVAPQEANETADTDSERGDAKVAASGDTSSSENSTAGEGDGAKDTSSSEIAEARTAAVIAGIPGMDIVDLRVESNSDDDSMDDEDDSSEEEGDPYRAMDDASSRDSEIESVADEDVAEEIRQPRKPRPRRYKIQEVVKVRQILLVQVVKEERGNKGAALTTYLSLAGRYCVLMPNTARGGGISRKITNVVDRKKLKQIAAEIDVPKGAGLIIRTAGSQRTKSEIKRDYEYLQRLWEQIRELTLKSIAPTKIYEEGDLIKRSIRDLYNREIDEVFVEGTAGYKTAKTFMKMIMPSHAKNVKLYSEALPLFARYQVESYLSSMFNPTVQLKSGGYIVIGVTEALVAIDVNSGRSTKEGSIEDTALKTNTEAAEEIARQLRLRDLAGLIVIDFIDMEERKNNASVEKRFKEKLKTDRARIQVGRISAFGLLEMSRQRLRPGMLEASTQPCPACHGTGLLRSTDSLGLQILRQVEEEGTRRKTLEVLIKAPIEVANFLINQKREHVAGIEARYGMSVRIEGDPSLVSPNFVIEKFKTQTRVVETVAPVVSVDASLMQEIDDAVSEVEEETEVESESEADEAVEAKETSEEPSSSDEGAPSKKRRRRRRRRKGGQRDVEAGSEDGEAESARDSGGSEMSDDQPDATAPAAAEEEPREEKPSRPRRSRSRSRRKPAEEVAEQDAGPGNLAEADGEPVVAEYAPMDGGPADATAEGEQFRSAELEAPVQVAASDVPEHAADPDGSDAPKDADASMSVPADAPAENAIHLVGSSAEHDHPEKQGEEDRVADAVTHAEAESTPSDEAAEPIAPAEVADEPARPKRRGWWSFGG